MFRKMILVFTAFIALTAWASAKPGTWGKEQPADTNQPKRPAAMFNRWLNEFSAAYQQRDGEAMDELLKRFDGTKEEYPAAPRIERWMDNVKEAYQQQDVRKMGRLLDNAQQLRDRIRNRMMQNQDRRRGYATEGFRFNERPMRGFDGRFEGPIAQRPRAFDERPFDTQKDFGPAGRPGFRHESGIPADRPFDMQRPGQQEWGPRRLRPHHQSKYGPMQQQRFGQSDFGRRQGQEDERFERPMRPEYNPPFDDEQGLYRPLRQRNRDISRDFWD